MQVGWHLWIWRDPFVVFSRVGDFYANDLTHWIPMAYQNHAFRDSFTLALETRLGFQGKNCAILQPISNPCFRKLRFMSTHDSCRSVRWYHLGCHTPIQHFEPSEPLQQYHGPRRLWSVLKNLKKKHRKLKAVGKLGKTAKVCQRSLSFKGMISW